MNRYFDLYLTAGHSVPVVINANQYDSSETWIFTLYTEDDQLYTPASGSIVGLKSDGHTIANAGTVNNDGQVVIQETVQITAAKGINVFELVLDGNHGTANFVVLVEPRPGDNVTPSDSELTLMEQAIAAAGSIEAVSALQDTVNSVASRMDEFIADHAGLSTETVLWTGNLFKTYQSPSVTPTGGMATLSQKVTDFDYIGVYTTMNTLGGNQTSDVHWYNADEFADKPTMVTCGTTKAYFGATDWVAIPYITLLMDSDEVTCTVFNAGLVSWNGQAESNATSQTSEGSTNYQGSVVKIVGIKNTQNDTEVIDARVGADGTVYNTLEARLNAENSDLKSAIAKGSGLTNEAKVALLNIFQHVAYADADGQAYYDALETALNPPTNLSYISAVYTQESTIVYDTDSLDSLRSNLVVTAHYDDMTTATITSYTLSGTLSVGTSTVTVTYSGKTTTFNVTVTERTYGWYYPFNNSIESVGTKDFGWTGPANFGEGVNGQAFHKISGTDPVKTISPTNKPNLSGDFTFAVWFKQPNDDANTYLFCNHDAKKGTGHTVKNSLTAGSVTMHDSNWSYTIASIGAYQDMAGFTVLYANSLLAIRGWDNTGNATGFQIRFTPPASLDRTQWNHYAVTRSGNTIMVFVNGHKIASFTCSYALYFADRVTFGATFTERTSTDTIDSGSSNHEAYYDDMYLNDSTCKWTADFDPETIVY